MEYEVSHNLADYPNKLESVSRESRSDGNLRKSGCLSSMSVRGVGEQTRSHRYGRAVRFRKVSADRVA